VANPTIYQTPQSKKKKKKLNIDLYLQAIYSYHSTRQQISPSQQWPHRHQRIIQKHIGPFVPPSKSMVSKISSLEGKKYT